MLPCIYPSLSKTGTVHTVSCPRRVTTTMARILWSESELRRNRPHYYQEQYSLESFQYFRHTLARIQNTFLQNLSIVFFSVSLHHSLALIPFQQIKKYITQYTLQCYSLARFCWVFWFSEFILSFFNIFNKAIIIIIIICIDWEGVNVGSVLLQLCTNCK